MGKFWQMFYLKEKEEKKNYLLTFILMTFAPFDGS